jgi:hypothetical protein
MLFQIVKDLNPAEETDAQGLAEGVYKATCAAKEQSSWGISARPVPSL